MGPIHLLFSGCTFEENLKLLKLKIKGSLQAKNLQDVCFYFLEVLLSLLKPILRTIFFCHQKLRGIPHIDAPPTWLPLDC